MISEDIRTFLARIFLGKARVHSIGADRRSVSARGIARKVDTRPLRSPQRALGSTLLGAGMDARVKGFSLPGGAFAGAGAAAATYMRSWQDFDLVQLVTLPMFHVGGCAASEIGTFSHRGTLVMMTAFDAGLMLELIESEKAYVFPTHVGMDP